MKWIAAFFGGVLVLFVVVFLWFIGLYNGLVSKREAVSSAWAQVQNVYQRRADLVPNLVQTVKGAAHFEKSTLTAVVEARARVGSVNIDKSVLNDPQAFKKFQAAQDSLSSALSHLMMISERYPKLTATANFRDLQVQLEGTENRITVERRNFNDAAQTYNTAIESMPAAFIAAPMGFKARPYFEAAASAQATPQVQF